MSARFIISRRCETKEQLTLTGLLDLHRQQGLLALFEETAAALGIDPARPDEPLELVSPGGTEVMTFTLRQLKEQTALLREHRRPCRVCPVSMTGKVGGCVAYLPYPLSEGMEYLFWVVAVQAVKRKLPQDMQPLALQFVGHSGSLTATPWADAMRRDGNLMAPRPRRIAWGPFFDRRRVTTSQLLERFFAVQVTAGEDLMVHYGFLCGVVAHGRALLNSFRGTDEERFIALQEDLAPYTALQRLMQIAINEGHGLQIWP